jgi:hypothetical protein
MTRNDYVPQVSVPVTKGLVTVDSRTDPGARG